MATVRCGSVHMRGGERGGARAAVLVLLGIGALVAGGGYWFISSHGFSARARPSALETFIARRVRGLATPAAATHQPNPLSPSPLVLAEARDHFADHCAVCHANDGSGKTPINDGLYPPAPDLREESTQRLTDGELFYIVRNGIRFTGMPGWGGADDENWQLVLFIRHLPKLSADELELMREVDSGGH